MIFKMLTSDMIFKIITSKTMLGLLVSVVGKLLADKGIDINEGAAINEITLLIPQIMQWGGLLFAAFGKIVSKTLIIEPKKVVNV